MRLLTIGLGLALGVVLALGACGQDPSSQSTGTGGAPNCDDVIIVYQEDAGNKCDVCLHKECCAEIAACTDIACLDCVNLFTVPCNLNENATTVHICTVQKCYDPCYPKVISNSGTGGTGGASSSSSG